MRKLVLQEFVSIDALAADANGGVDFVPASNTGDESFERQQFAFLDSIDTMLLGRVTYEMFAAYWPNVPDGDEKPFADRLNALKKVVVSRSINSAPWGNWSAGRIVRGAIAEEVVQLKQQPGKDIVVWGSLSIARALMQHGLVDEVQLIVCPLVLGQGTPLFGAEMDARRLELFSAEPYSQGSVRLTYIPVSDVR
jgi:dihydrofolate reductase